MTAAHTEPAGERKTAGMSPWIGKRKVMNGSY